MLGLIVLLLGLISSYFLVRCCLKDLSLIQAVIFVPAAFASIISLGGFLFNLVGFRLTQINYLMLFLFLMVPLYLILRKKDLRPMERKQLFLLIVILAASFLLAEYFAMPSLLPVGASDDAPRHFGLINYIYDLKVIPAAGSAMPLSNYSPGLHVNAAFFSDIFQIQPVYFIHTYLSLLFSLTIGALYVFGLRRLGQKGALILVILAATSPLMFSVPLAQGYWPQFLALFLFLCFLDIESESSHSSLAPGFLSAIIASALVIIYPLYAIPAILALTIMRLSAIKPLTSGANKRYLMNVSVWLATIIAFAVRTRFFTTIQSFNQFGKRAIIFAVGIGIVLLLLASLVIVLRTVLRPLFVRAMRGKIVTKIKELRVVDAAGFLVCMLGLLVTIGTFLARYLWVGSIFDDRITPTTTQTLMFYTVWALAALASVGLIWYLAERQGRPWYHVFFAANAIVLTIPLALLLGFSSAPLLKYLVYKMVFILIVPVLFFTAFALKESLAAAMGKGLKEGANTHSPVLASAVLLLVPVVILMQGAVTIHEGLYFPRSVKPTELRVSQWLALRHLPPEKTWYTGDLPKQLWHMHIAEIYEKADKKWYDRHPTVTLSDWPERAKPGDVLLVNDASNFGDAGSEYKEIRTFSHQKDDLDIYQTLNVKGKVGNNSQQFEDATTARVIGFSNGIQEFLYPKDITEPGMVTYSFRQRGSIQSFKADIEVRALTKEDSVTILYSTNNGRTWVGFDRLANTDWKIVSVSIKPEALKNADGVKLRFDLRSKSSDVGTGIRRMNAYMTTDTTGIALEAEPQMTLKQDKTSIKYPILHKDGVSVVVRYVSPLRDR